jgi:RES domain-containing protein
MTNVPIPGEPKPPPVPPPPFPGQKPVREPDPPHFPDEEPLPNPDENDEPPQHTQESRQAGAAFAGAHAFDRFAQEIEAHSRYIRSADAEHFLHAVAVTCHRRVESVPSGTIYWRAQVGHGWERGEIDGRKVRGPHSRERMKPLHDRAYEGRVNPKGIPCLYFATSREVAISEVRPWLGSAVTVARFRTLTEMKLIDCTKRDGNTPPSAEDVENSVWTAIDRAFARPVIETDNKAEYAATQAIAEIFRQEGLDGVIYRSAYAGNGRNVALFDLESAEVVDQALYEICRIDLDFREIVPEGDPQEDAREIPSKGRR